MTLRERLESLRRRIDATDADVFYEKARNEPRPLIERIQVSPGAEEAVRRIVFETNPWDGPIETDPSLPEGTARLSMLTGFRSARTETLAVA